MAPTSNRPTTAWKANVRADLSELGYNGVLDYLTRNAAKPYHVLAQQLGQYTAAVHLARLAWEEAKPMGIGRWLAKDSLIRHIRSAFGKGWGVVCDPSDSTSISRLAADETKEPDERSDAEKLQFQRGTALGGWAAEIPSEYSDIAGAVCDALKALNPPIGWLPSSHEDSLIQAAFAAGWPEGREKNFKPERVASRLRELGYESMLDYLEDHPGIPYRALAVEIGPDPIAREFLRDLHLEEAHRHGTLRRAAMDCLVREIIACGGWPGTLDVDDPLESYGWPLYGEWAIGALSRYGEDAVELGNAAWDALQRRNPPKGWIPFGPDDPIIQAAFAEGWAERMHPR